MKQYKIVASRGGQMIFDERIEATTPRDARRQLKARLGLRSLCGIVYAITEIPLELIREMVTVQMARVVSYRSVDILSATDNQSGQDADAPLIPELDLHALISMAVNEITLGALEGIAARLEALEARRTGATRTAPQSHEAPTESRPVRFDPMSTPVERSVDILSATDNPSGQDALAPLSQEPPSPPPVVDGVNPEDLRAIIGPDWRAIQSHYLQTRKVKQTAALFNLSINTLKARIRREGWGR